MSAILIDVDHIIIPRKLDLLKRRIKPIPETKSSIGLILIVEPKYIKILENTEKGEKSVEYINSEEFVNNIKDYSYLVYDKHKRLCEIVEYPVNYMNLLIKIAMESLPNDILLCSKVAKKDLNIFIKIGFNHPFIAEKSPLGFKEKDKTLFMLRKNNMVDNNSTEDLNYLLSQQENEKCSLSFVLTEQSIKYLKKLTKIGFTDNDNGNISQKEIAGRFKVKNIDKGVHHLSIDKKSIIHGDEDGVMIIDGLYNFHTHPKQAYNKYKVDLGWPSAQDFIGFLGSVIVYHTILHIVISIEGMYLLTLRDYWINKTDELNNNTMDFISKNYDKCSDKHKGIKWYLKEVNNIKYKGYPLFRVEYLNWKEPIKRKIKLQYQKNMGNCITRQETSDILEKIYD